MTFPSNVHFETKLVSSSTAQGEKKKKSLMFSFHYIFLFPPLSHTLSHSHPFSICLSHTSFLSLHTLLLFHDPRVLFQQQSITHSTSSSSLALLQSEHRTLSLSSPLVCLTITLSFTSSPSPLGEHLTSLCLFTCDPLFLISDFLSDWQISIILEDLHKSLPSHFLAEMAFLPICTVSDHIEPSLHTALIPIFFTDTVKEEGCDFESEARLATF